MFGLVKFPVTGGERKSKPKTKPKARRSARPSVRRKWGALLQPDLHRQVTVFVKRVIAAIRLRDFSLRMRLGLDDPADTGLLWALLGTASAFVPMDVAPDFTGETLEVDTQGNVRIVPVQLAWITARFALSPATVRAAWAWRRA
jgi:hypothetical protein